ncbi:MAG: hypothetical protein [Bacteriophage sp.]|nr:MAG: hypothetical protein [Bacteriophage sp.]
MKYVIEGFQINADNLEIANHKLELAKKEFAKSELKGLVKSNLKQRMIQSLINGIDETGKIADGLYINLIVKDNKVYRQRGLFSQFENKL